MLNVDEPNMPINRQRLAGQNKKKNMNKLYAGDQRHTFDSEIQMSGKKDYKETPCKPATKRGRKRRKTSRQKPSLEKKKIYPTMLRLKSIK